MKLTILIACVCLVQVSASVTINGQNISINVSGQPLKEVIKSIESKSNYRFFYNESFVDLNKPVTVAISDKPVTEVLDNLFEGSKVSYKVLENNLIVIAPVSELQQQRITGKITDASNGEPLTGVYIMVKGTNQGVVSDLEGYFSLDVSESGSTLVFSFIGYNSEEVILQDQSVINIALIPSIQALDEIVVVGYGAVKKSDLTGSVSSIKYDDFKKSSLSSFDQAIQGKAAGVQVTQASSAPGGKVLIRVRGGNSLSGSNEPLFIVDGFPISAGTSAGGNGAGQNPLATINPSDIASIEILKDASSTAIYGSRGANGVVLITTKRGQVGKTKVTFDGYWGVQKVAKKLDMMNAREFADLVNEARANNTPTPLAPAFPNPSNPYYFPDPSVLGEGVDYQDEVFRSASVNNYNLGVSGGNDLIRFSVGGSYFAQQGVVKNSDFQRASFRSNIDTRLSRNVTITSNITASHVWGNNGNSEGDGGNNAGVINSAVLMPPTVPIFQEDGVTYTRLNPTPGGSTIQNPVPIVKHAVDYQEIDRFLGSVDANWQILKSLSFKVTLGTDMSMADRQIYWPKETVLGFNAKGQASQANRKMTSYLNENILTFNKAFGSHSLNVVGGYTWQVFNNRDFFAGATNFPTDLYDANNLDAGTVYSPPTSERTKSQLASYLGRVNYIFNEKYLLTVTARADGSSKFGANNRWAFFPSVAMAWRVSEERFMESLSQISNLKLRASYGKSGNQDILSYQSLALLNTMNYPLGGQLNSGVGPTKIPNADLRWETTATTDIGIDLGVFNNRLNLVVDYYYKKTTDLLWNISTPQTAGFPFIFKNVGSLENKGFEVSLGADIFTGELKWNSQLNWSRNRNKVLEIPGFTPATQGTLSGHLKVSGSWLEPGLPVGVWNLLQYDGVFQDQAQLEAGPTSSGAKLGDARFVDKSGDGTIKYTDDRMIVGDPNPDFIYGWSNNFRYKGFDLSVYIQGSYGNDIINIQRAETNVSGPWGNQRREMLNRWTPTNTNTDIPRARVTVDPLLLQSSWLIEDGSYLRFKTITLGYTLPEFKFMSSCRIYVTGQNLITFTDYSGFDPEVNSQGNSALQLGVDYNAYPASKSVMIGASVTF